MHCVGYYLGIIIKVFHFIELLIVVNLEGHLPFIGNNTAGGQYLNQVTWNLIELMYSQFLVITVNCLKM